MVDAPSSILDVALAARAAGLSIVPAREDGSKRPLGTWRRYEHALPSEAEIRAWYTNGRQGIGIVCGAVSGNLELLDFDHGGAEVWKQFVQRCHERGIGDVLDRVVAGYAEKTPRGEGVHALYRCTGPVDGNLKLARRSATAAELAENPDEKVKVIFETRGEGGYVVTAPSGGPVHPSGRPWLLVRGGFDQIATITPNERQALLDVARSFDEPVVEERQPEPSRAASARPNTTGESWMDQTVDSFNTSTTWAEILAPHGWTEMRPQGGVGYWCRPGKDPRLGHSATTNATGADRFILWSSSVSIPGVEVATGAQSPSYDRFGVWAGYHHGGDRVEAAKAARHAGYGPEWRQGGESIDLDDLVAGGTTSPAAPGAPANVATMADEEPWETPLPLEGPPPPDFPLDALPGWVGDHCAVVADRLQVPVDLCGQLALGVLAAVAMKQATLRVSGSWVEPLNLYLTTVMPSGSGKSPASRAITAALVKFEDELIELHASTVRQAHIEQQVAERRAKRALEAASKEDGDIGSALAAQALADAVEVPPVPRLIASDATPEVLVTLLDRHGGRIALVSTEAELYDLVLGDKGQRIKLGPYLKPWDGDDLIVDRKGGSGSPGTEAKIRNPLMTVSITVQAGALDALRTKPELVSRGFVQRFCYAWPPSLVGRRVWDPDADTTIPTTGEWERRVLDIGRRLHSFASAAELRLSEDARRLFFNWRQDLEHLLGEDDGRAEFVSKLSASALRVAGLLHLAEDRRHSDPVDVELMERAITLGGYWLAHADAVWLQFGTDSSLAGARAILRWLQRERPATFRRRDVYAANRRTFPKASDADEAIATLVEHGWIRPSPSQKRRDSPRFDTHPEVLR